MKPIGFPEQILTDEEIKIHETYFLLDPRLKQSHLAANARIRALERLVEHERRRVDMYQQILAGCERTDRAD
jgi:hypothetical protein